MSLSSEISEKNKNVNSTLNKESQKIKNNFSTYDEDKNDENSKSLSSENNGNNEDDDNSDYDDDLKYLGRCKEYNPILAGEYDIEAEEIDEETRKKKLEKLEYYKKQEENKEYYPKTLQEYHDVKTK